MNVKSEAVVTHIQKALVALNEAIEDFNGELSFTTVEQLGSFLSELQRMKAEVETENLTPREKRSSWMGRTICDGWPLGSSLGEVIARAENSYLSL